MPPFIQERSRDNPFQGVSAIIYFLDSIWHYRITWRRSCKIRAKENTYKNYVCWAFQRGCQSTSWSSVLSVTRTLRIHIATCKIAPIRDQHACVAQGPSCHHLSSHTWAVETEGDDTEQPPQCPPLLTPFRWELQPEKEPYTPLVRKQPHEHHNKDD